MKAVVRQKSKLVIKEIKEPFIKGDDEIKIRVHYNTISNREIKHDGMGDFFAKDGIVGYECCGEIIALGEVAKEAGYKVGDKVTSNSIRACGRCIFCQSGKYYRCNSGKFITGTLCRFITRSFREVTKLEENISFKAGCLTVPIAEVLQGCEDIGVILGKSVVIFGAGFTGLIYAKALKQWGARNVTVVEPIESRRLLALQRGVDAAFDWSDEHLCERLFEVSDFNGYDILIDTTGNVGAIGYCFKMAAFGARILLTDYSSPVDKILFNTMQLLKQNVNIIFSWDGSRKMEEAAFSISTLKAEELIESEVPLDKYREVIKALKSKDIVKAAIKID